MKAGYLRKNGVRYGEGAVLTEILSSATTSRTATSGSTVTRVVDDPTSTMTMPVRDQASSFTEGARMPRSGIRHPCDIEAARK
jgi:hypothetical protein